MSNGISIAGRKENDGIDFYETPKWCIEKLFENENFEGEIFEPACGNGAIMKVCENLGIKVKGCDIRTDEYIYGKKGVNFLLLDNEVEYFNIVTNPPYCLGKEFIEKSLQKTYGKVAMFLKLQFLESADRYEFFKNTPLKKVYVFSKRPTLYPANGPIPKNKGTIAYAWYIWEKGYKGKPMIDWIL